MKKVLVLITVSSLSLFLSYIAVFGGGSHEREKWSGLMVDNSEGKVDTDLFLAGCNELIDDNAITAGSDDVFKFNQGNNYWSVIGLRPDTGSDWDISLFSDSCGTGDELAYSWSYEDSTEFVVADYNHSPTGWEGVWIGRWAGTGNARVEYENSTETLVVGPNAGIDWPADDVVEIWDIYLEPGDYDFELITTSGTADLGIAIFASDDSSYYAGRWESPATSDGDGGGGYESFTFTAPQADWYGLVVWANDANSAIFDINIGLVGIGDGKGAGPSLPSTFALNQNYPNPFNPSTVISYQLPERANVTLRIHDIRGRMVRDLVNRLEEVGSHSVQWDGTDGLDRRVPSGVYFYVLDTDKGYRSTRKMVILK